MLPTTLKHNNTTYFINITHAVSWYALYADSDGIALEMGEGDSYEFSADNPCEAAVLLLIKLIENGIVKVEDLK